MSAEHEREMREAIKQAIASNQHALALLLRLAALLDTERAPS